MGLKYDKARLEVLADVLANYLDHCTTSHDDGLDDHGDATPQMKDRVDHAIRHYPKRDSAMVDLVIHEPMAKALLAAIDLHDATMPEHWAVNESLKAEIKADIEGVLKRLAG